MPWCQRVCNLKMTPGLPQLRIVTRDVWWRVSTCLTISWYMAKRGSKAIILSWTSNWVWPPWAHSKPAEQTGYWLARRLQLEIQSWMDDIPQLHRSMLSWHPHNHTVSASPGQKKRLTSYACTSAGSETICQNTLTVHRRISYNREGPGLYKSQAQNVEKEVRWSVWELNGRVQYARSSGERGKGWPKLFA